MGEAEMTLIESVVALFPQLVQLVGKWIADDKDPKAELDKLLDTADAVADAAEKAKFGA